MFINIGKIYGWAELLTISKHKHLMALIKSMCAIISFTCSDITAAAILSSVTALNK